MCGAHSCTTVAIPIPFLCCLAFLFWFCRRPQFFYAFFVFTQLCFAFCCSSTHFRRVFSFQHKYIYILCTHTHAAQPGYSCSRSHRFYDFGLCSVWARVGECVKIRCFSLPFSRIISIFLFVFSSVFDVCVSGCVCSLTSFLLCF